MAVKIRDILGINARNHEYLARYNKAKGKRIANSKLLTKSKLKKAKISVPKLYGVIRSERDIAKFRFSKLNESFVIKPNKGLGGEGIIVIEGKDEEEGCWVNTEGKIYQTDDLKLHMGDILEGRFSLNDWPDIAFVEERIRIHPVFSDYAYHGTPDIRIIVFNNIPVMAMLRIPTKESGGRANLFQGAVGAGIDIASGVTNFGLYHGKEINSMPDTEVKIRGIEIPEWDKVLELAINCQNIVSLGYLGADIVLQPSIKKIGKTIPKVLELNAQPGLKIQLANKAGLRRRLERIEGLDVPTPEKGIKIAKELFGDRSMAHLGKTLKKIGIFEIAEIVVGQERIPAQAKIDTGAYSTSIDYNLAQRLGLLKEENILYQKKYRSALGTHTRPVISLEFYLNGRKIKTSASVVDRSELKRPILIGRRDLNGFIVEFK